MAKGRFDYGQIAYKDPTEGMRSALSGMQEMALEREKTERELARQKILDDRYQSNLDYQRGRDADTDLRRKKADEVARKERERLEMIRNQNTGAASFLAKEQAQDFNPIANAMAERFGTTDAGRGFNSIKEMSLTPEQEMREKQMIADVSEMSDSESEKAKLIESMRGKDIAEKLKAQEAFSTTTKDSPYGFDKWYGNGRVMSEYDQAKEAQAMFPKSDIAIKNLIDLKRQKIISDATDKQGYQDMRLKLIDAETKRAQLASRANAESISSAASATGGEGKASYFRKKWDDARRDDDVINAMNTSAKNSDKGTKLPALLNMAEDARYKPTDVSQAIKYASGMTDNIIFKDTATFNEDKFLKYLEDYGRRDPLAASPTSGSKSSKLIDLEYKIDDQDSGVNQLRSAIKDYETRQKDIERGYSEDDLSAFGAKRIVPSTNVLPPVVPGKKDEPTKDEIDKEAIHNAKIKELLSRQNEVSSPVKDKKVAIAEKKVENINEKLSKLDSSSEADASEVFNAGYDLLSKKLEGVDDSIKNEMLDAWTIIGDKNKSSFSKLGAYNKLIGSGLAAGISDIAKFLSGSGLVVGETAANAAIGIPNFFLDKGNRFDSATTSRKKRDLRDQRSIESAKALNLGSENYDINPIAPSIDGAGLAPEEKVIPVSKSSNLDEAIKNSGYHFEDKLRNANYSDIIKMSKQLINSGLKMNQSDVENELIFKKKAISER